MSLFDNTVKVTGHYAFSFTTFIWNHEWDGWDYAYFHDVNEEQGKKAYQILEKELGVEGKSMEELFRLKYGEKLSEESCGEEVFSFCLDNDIEYEMTVVQI